MGSEYFVTLPLLLWVGYLVWYFGEQLYKRLELWRKV